MSGKTAAALLAALTAVQLLVAVASMRGDSATADEGAHIAAGYVKLVYGRLDFFREQPPLMNSLSVLPLVMAGYRFPLPPIEETNHWVVGRDFLFRSGYDSGRILFLARLPTLLLFVALAWLAYAFTLGETGSRPWSLAAFALVAFCPNLLAHGRLATVDMASAFFCFLAGMLLVRLLRDPRLSTGAALGVTTAAAVLSKTSGLILGPFGLVVLALAVASKRVPADARLRLLNALAVALVAAVIVVEVVIAGEASDSFIERRYGDVSRFTLPFREIAANIETIRSWYSGDNFAAQFLLGRFSQKGWWYYYPVALLLKVTIPSLIVTAVALLLLVIRRRATFGAMAALTFATLFLAVAARSQIVLGVRYVLPILPFLYTGAVIVISRSGGRKLALATLLLVSWHVAEAMVAYPSYIGYFNQSIGDRRHADRYLIDSNLDWGQDLRRLDQWCRSHGVPSIAIAYFGGGDIDSDLSIKAIPIWNVEAAHDIPRNGYFAVSRHLYRLSFWTSVSPRSWGEVLQERGARYVTTIGTGIDVYEIPAGPSRRYGPSGSSALLW